MEDDKKFQHYTPQHPLPEELKKLARDDTVCKYCGVSYLIHNEIKALEDKLKILEKELKLLRGQEAREKILTEENKSLQQRNQELNKTINLNTDLIKNLNSDIEKQKDALKTAEEKAVNYKNTYMNTLQQLSNTTRDTKILRQNLDAIKRDVKSDQSAIKTNFKSALQHILHIQKNTKADREAQESKMELLNMEKVVLAESNRKLINELKEQEELLTQTKETQDKKDKKLNDMENSLLQLQKLDFAVKEKDTEIEELKRKAEEEKTKSQKSNTEFAELQSSLKKISKELKEALQKNGELEKSQELASQKFNLDLKNKTEEVVSLEKKLKLTEVQYRELERRQNHSQEENKLKDNESDELKDKLERSKADCEAMRKEREMLIEAHQNRIQELRNSFKQKLDEANNWPQKIQEAVASERVKHSEEMKKLEESLKHNFVMELQIEKDKYNELLKKIQEQEKTKTADIDNQLLMLEAKLRQDQAEQERKYNDLKTRKEEREAEQTREIESLKKIINDLQDKLARLDVEDSGKVAELRMNLQTIHGELNQAQEEVEKLTAQVNEAREEAQFLQNIVKKECEERFELTEALSEARKELLQLKMPAGGYGRTSKRGSLDVESLAEVASLKSSSPQQMVTAVNLSLRNNPSSKSHDNDTSVDDTRKRIAAMMGRPT